MRIKQREDVSRLIKGACAVRGLTGKELAERMRISAPSLSRMVNSSNISLHTLLAMASAMGAELVLDFVTDDEERAAAAHGPGKS